jgi:hypothetical protein
MLFWLVSLLEMGALGRRIWIFDEPFSNDYEPTHDVLRRCEPVLIGEQSVALQMHEFSRLDAPKSLQGRRGRPAVILLAYGLTDPGTFENIQGWLHAVHQLPGMRGDGVWRFVVGNKMDLIAEPNVLPSLRRKSAGKSRLQFFNVSAKNGSNISELGQAVMKISLDSRAARGSPQRPD